MLISTKHHSKRVLHGYSHCKKSLTNYTFFPTFLFYWNFLGKNLANKIMYINFVAGKRTITSWNVNHPEQKLPGCEIISKPNFVACQIIFQRFNNNWTKVFFRCYLLPHNTSTSPTRKRNPHPWFPSVPCLSDSLHAVTMTLPENLFPVFLPRTRQSDVPLLLLPP